MWKSLVSAYDCGQRFCNHQIGSMHPLYFGQSRIALRPPKKSLFQPHRLARSRFRRSSANCTTAGMSHRIFALTQSGDLFDYAKDLFVGAKQAVLAALG
jgi:hypothetical protein